MRLLSCEPLSPNDREKRGLIRFDDDVLMYMPTGAIGGSDKKSEFAPEPITFHWNGQKILADMPRYRDRDSLRKYFRTKEDGLIKKFFDEAGAEVGDVVQLEVLGTHDFGLRLKKAGDAAGPSSSAPSPEAERQKKWVQRETRPEQQKFRKGIVDRDGLKCSISGCDIPEVLDAAHLHGHADNGSSDPSNGIILRKDLHGLFDGGLLQLGRDGRVSFKPSIIDPVYTQYEGAILATKADLENLRKRGKS